MLRVTNKHIMLSVVDECHGTQSKISNEFWSKISKFWSKSFL